MKGKQLLVLLVAVLVIGGWAYYHARHSGASVTSAKMGKPVLPDLAINAIRKIVVNGAGASISVVKEESGWVVREKYGFPASFEKIRTALRALADLKIGQVERVGPVQREELQLLTPEAAAARTNAAGRKITLFGAQDKPIATLVLGKQHHRPVDDPRMAEFGGGPPDGRYIALPNGDVYFVTEPLSDLDADTRGWMDDEFLHIPAQDLTRIAFSSPGQQPWTLARANDAAELTLEGLATNETTDSARVGGLTGALGYLRFDDVADPALTPERTGLDRPAVLEATAKDGHRFQFNIGTNAGAADQRYVSVRVAFHPPPEPPPPPVTETNAAAAASNQAARAIAAEQQRKTAAEADALNQRLSRWTFLMNSATLNSLLSDRAGLLKKPEPPAPESSTLSGPETAVGKPAGQDAVVSGGTATPPR